MNPPKSVYTALYEPTQVPIVLKLQRFGLRDSAPEFKFEIDTMAKLLHPGIISCYGCFWFYSSKISWEGVIVMEKADSDLMEAVNRKKQQEKRWSDLEVLTMAYDLVDALAYCELQGICHRDIKLSNILYQQGNVKITDFGISKSIQNETESHTICGSIAYLSPILRKNYGSLATVQHNPYKSDVYSLGVTLFAVCNLGLPSQVFSDSPSFISEVGKLPYCETVKALLTAMLERNEDLRPSHNQIQAALASALGYKEACPHIAKGLEEEKAVNCHGKLCKYCYIDSKCRLCLATEPTMQPASSENNPDLCTICHKLPGKLPFCALHYVCSEQCVISYCQESCSNGHIGCPVCSTPISEEILAFCLKNTLIDGLTVSCLRCNSIKLVENSLILVCTKHALCQLCMSEVDATYPVKCPKCENTQICAKCQLENPIKDVFRFECNHLICQKCIEVGERQQCPLCLSSCEVCKRRINSWEAKKPPCGHANCPQCSKVPCGVCFTYCLLCRTYVAVSETFPLECGTHSVCLIHAQLIPCSLCRS